MKPLGSKRILVALTAAGGLTALLVTLTGSLVLGAVAGVVVLAVAVLVARDRKRGPGGDPPDPGRRRLLLGTASMGIAVVAAGTAAGHSLRRLTRRNPRPVLESMAGGLGNEAMESVRRGYYPGRSGELQLVLAPFSSSNYAGESKTLVPRDPRTSHAAVWPYLERVPIVVYAPGIVAPNQDFTDRVTLADLAPSTALLMGFDFPAPDGAPLPGLRAPARPPKVIVTFVIDGGGWNFLEEWPDTWPTIKRLARSGATYRNAVMGSFPAVTASAHATIGTGAFPRVHGISGHNIRKDGAVVKAYGVAGRADPSDLLAPTLADAWSEHTGGRAWIGELGYQIWHLGMIGRGRDRASGEPVVGVFWDEDRNLWAPQNPDLYRMPSSVPERRRLSAYLEEHFGEEEGAQIDTEGGKTVCCTSPIIRYQGDLIETAFESEPIGAGDVTDLLYINYKAPDYAGHVFNMQHGETAKAMAAVDAQLDRLVRMLERRYSPGEYVLIVTADHGQCPLPDDYAGVRVDPVQLNEDLRREFGHSLFSLVDKMAPSEIYVSSAALWDGGFTIEDVAAFLGDYRYRDNIGWYVPDAAIQHDLTDERPFAAVLPTTFIEEMGGVPSARFGSGRHAEAEPGLPPRTW